jgi:hypothetical protein
MNIEITETEHTLLGEHLARRIVDIETSIYRIKASIKHLETDNHRMLPRVRRDLEDSLYRLQCLLELNDKLGFAGNGDNK